MQSSHVPGWRFVLISSSQWTDLLPTKCSIVDMLWSGSVRRKGSTEGKVLQGVPLAYTSANAGAKGILEQGHKWGLKHLNEYWNSCHSQLSHVVPWGCALNRLASILVRFAPNDLHVFTQKFQFVYSHRNYHYRAVLSTSFSLLSFAVLSWQSLTSIMSHNAESLYCDIPHALPACSEPYPTNQMQLVTVCKITYGLFHKHFWTEHL